MSDSMKNVLTHPPCVPSPNSDPQPPKTSSNKLLDDWLGSATLFRGFTGTRPSDEVKNADWEQIVTRLCPDQPELIGDKKQGIYFVPCELKEAPLVGKTLEAAIRNGEPTTGKMRSASHVTNAGFLVIDVDGLSEADVMAGQDQMKADRLTFLAYTSHSQGREDKPGMRVRFVIPIDREVATEDYSTAWNGIDQMYFAGQAGKSDSSGANMCQQQGTWACHPDRTEQAISWLNIAGVANTDVLIEAGKAVQQLSTPIPVKAKKLATTEVAPLTDATYPDADAHQVADACQQIGAFRKNKGAEQNEPLWRDCLGVVGHCTDGEKLCHEWSSGHPEYDETETQSKLVYRMRLPPTTCQQFRKTNPEGCHGCPQRINSPITLGWEKQDPLTFLQQQFALIKLDGKIFVFEISSLTELTAQGLARKLGLSSISDGRLLLKRALRSKFPQLDAAGIIEDYWSNPRTICYDGVEFNPQGASNNYLNLWMGPTIQLAAGSWSHIKSFLLEIICNGDQAAFEYLLKYIAHALQRPEEKPGVMIILVGGQGIGKGTLGKILQRIWSATYIQINNIDSVTGNFNASLERAFIIFMDEALFAGNRRASDALKSLVTETVIQVNEKYQPARQISSYHRFIAATNADHFKNTERDDRRDFTLRVSDAKKGDFGYWNALNHEIENGGVEAIAFDLMQMDLSSFNVRNKPNTGELLEQKLMSLEPIPRWWHDLLLVGGILDDTDWPDFIRTASIIDGVINVAGSRLYQKPSAQTIAIEMGKLCPSAQKAQRQDSLERSRGYSLPSLQQARAEFEEYIGGSIQWD